MKDYTITITWIDGFSWDRETEVYQLLNAKVKPNFNPHETYSTWDGRTIPNHRIINFAVEETA